jgi:hypothetical protein
VAYGSPRSSLTAGALTATEVHSGQEETYVHSGQEES